MDLLRFLNIANKGFPRSWRIQLSVLFLVLVFTPCIFLSSLKYPSLFRLPFVLVGSLRRGSRLLYQLDNQPVVHTEEVASSFTDSRRRLQHPPGSPLHGFVYLPPSVPTALAAGAHMAVIPGGGPWRWSTPSPLRLFLSPPANRTVIFRTAFQNRFFQGHLPIK